MKILLPVLLLALSPIICAGPGNYPSARPRGASNQDARSLTTSKNIKRVEQLKKKGGSKYKGAKQGYYTVAADVYVFKSESLCEAYKSLNADYEEKWIEELDAGSYIKLPAGSKVYIKDVISDKVEEPRSYRENRTGATSSYGGGMYGDVKEKYRTYEVLESEDVAAYAKALDEAAITSIVQVSVEGVNAVRGYALWAQVSAQGTRFKGKKMKR